MDNNTFYTIMVQIERGGIPPTLGYQINQQQFDQLAEAIIKNLYKHGWDNCKRYIDSWWIKII